MIAQELRIGNWVMGRSYKMALGLVPAKISMLGTKSVQLDRANGGNYENIKPIPLTEEILIKAGFETEDDQFTGIELPYYSLPGTPYFFHKGDLNELLHDEFGRFSIKVQNLHSLQNVIFALTGQELQISL